MLFKGGNVTQYHNIVYTNDKYINNHYITNSKFYNNPKVNV